MNHLAREGIIDLCSETANIDVDDVAIRVEGHIPHVLGNERAREDLPRPVTMRSSKSKELFRREIDIYIAPKGLVTPWINEQIFELQSLEA